MRLYICANTYTSDQQEKTGQCVEILRSLGHTFVDEPSDSEMIVSLGGDGALLRAARTALECDRPLIGINSGRLGHLCALKIDEIESFDQILEGCTVHKKTILECVNGEECFTALNDVVIGKDDFGQTVDLEVLICGKKVMDIRGDGLIVATPTGSSAYNISAGGPLVMDDSPVLLLTPICNHDTRVRPLIIADDKAIEICVKHEDAGIYIDGQPAGKTASAALVKKAKKALKLIQR